MLILLDRKLWLRLKIWVKVVKLKFWRVYRNWGNLEEQNQAITYAMICLLTMLKTCTVKVTLFWRNWFIFKQFSSNISKRQPNSNFHWRGFWFYCQKLCFQFIRKEVLQGANTSLKLFKIDVTDKKIKSQ